MTIERMERLLAGSVVLITVAGGLWISPWFFLLTALMGANLLQSGFTNWCPSMPVLRRLGFKDSP